MFKNPMVLLIGLPGLFFVLGLIVWIFIPDPIVILFGFDAALVVALVMAVINKFR